MEEALELQARRAGEAPATDHRPEDFLHPRAARPGSDSDEPEAPPSDAQARALVFGMIPGGPMLPLGMWTCYSVIHAAEPTLNPLLLVSHFSYCSAWGACVSRLMQTFMPS